MKRTHTHDENERTNQFDTASLAVPGEPVRARNGAQSAIAHRARYVFVDYPGWQPKMGPSDY